MKCHIRADNSKGKHTLESEDVLEIVPSPSSRPHLSTSLTYDALGMSSLTVSISDAAMPSGDAGTIHYNDGGSFGAIAHYRIDDSTGQLRSHNGSVTRPAFAFSDGAGNFDTGLFLQAANTLGIVCAGAAHVIISNTGVAVGQSGLLFNPAIGIRRVSAVVANSWEDGNCGNSTHLWLTPSDFGGLSQTRPVGVGARNNVAFATSGNGGTGHNHRACKMIPKGFVLAPEAPFQIFSRAAQVGTLRVEAFDINTNSSADFLFGSAGAPAAYTTNSAAALTGSAVTATGSGSTALFVDFLPTAGMNFVDNGITGMRIALTRI
jgi:hypothetical protein